MLLRKGLVLVLSLGLFGACASSQSKESTSTVSLMSDNIDAASGASSTDFQTKWASLVGTTWANISKQTDEEKKVGYWLNSEDFSMALLSNSYYSKVDKNMDLVRFSRNFCGSSSYDELIAEQIGDYEGDRFAQSYGMSMVAPDGNWDNPGQDAKYVSMMMTLWRYLLM